jgi:hypothetical protein
LGY